MDMQINIYLMFAILGGFLTMGVLGLMLRWMFSKVTREDVVTKADCASARSNCATAKAKTEGELSEAINRQFKLREDLPRDYVKKADHAADLERLDSSRKEDNARIDTRLISIEEKVDALLQRRTTKTTRGKR